MLNTDWTLTWLYWTAVGFVIFAILLAMRGLGLPPAAFAAFALGGGSFVALFALGGGPKRRA